jgi:hypothetical protein
MVKRTKRTKRVQNLEALKFREVQGTDKDLAKSIWRRVAENENSLATDYPISGTDRRVAFNINQIVNQIKSVFTQGLDVINSQLQQGSNSRQLNETTFSIMSKVSSLWDNLITYLDYIGYRSMTQRDIQAIYGLLDTIVPLVDSYSDAIDSANDANIFVPSFKGFIDFRNKITNRDLTSLSSLVYSKKDLLNNLVKPNRNKSKEEKLDDNVNLGSIELAKVAKQYLKSIYKKGNRNATLDKLTDEEIREVFTQKTQELDKTERDLQTLRNIPSTSQTSINNKLGKIGKLKGEIELIKNYLTQVGFQLEDINYYEDEVKSDLQPVFKRTGFEESRRPIIRREEKEENTPVGSQDLAEFDVEDELPVDEDIVVLEPVVSSSSSRPSLAPQYRPKESSIGKRKSGEGDIEESTAEEEAEKLLSNINPENPVDVERMYSKAIEERKKAVEEGNEKITKAWNIVINRLVGTNVGARMALKYGSGMMRNKKRNEPNCYVSMIHKGINSNM